MIGRNRRSATEAMLEWLNYNFHTLIISATVVFFQVFVLVRCNVLLVPHLERYNLKGISLSMKDTVSTIPSLHFSLQSVTPK